MAATTPLLFIFLIIISLPFSSCLPFIVIHGLGDQCSSPTRSEFTARLSEWSMAQGYCMEVGNGIRDSWFVPLEQQAQVICKKVKEMPQLTEGFNLVGVSQGSLIGRAIVQYCDGAPPVKNFVSMGGVHAGTAVLPNCGTGSFCNVVDSLLQSDIYSSYVQDHLAPSNYIKIPTKIPDYLNGNKFLPKLNNELPNERNATYKERFTSIEKLILIMFEQDTVLVPKQTSWFDFFADGGYETLVPHQQTKLYVEDWIGLRTLDEAGKVTYVGVPGEHLQIAQEDMKKYIVPYLKDESETKIQTSDGAKEVM